VIARMSVPAQSAGAPAGQPDPRSEVLVLFSDAGGGHRNAAAALVAAAEETGVPLRLRMVGLNEVLGGWDVVRACTGRSTEETYNELLRRGRTRFLVPLLRLLHAATTLLHGPLVKSAVRFLRVGARPAAVLSVHPNFNRVLRDAVREALPGVPFVVLLTDYADFPPHFWIEPGVDRVIAGCGTAVEQAAALGLPRERVTLVSGMPLHPSFYRGGGPDARGRMRAELGVPAGARVVLVLFGGKGAAEMEPLCGDLLRADPEWHVVAVCGHNPGLLARVEALAAGAAGRLHALGFSRKVADLMAAADVLAAKPGPGVLAEAFHQRLPVVVTCNAGTIPQERFNAQMVAERGLGLVARDWRAIPAAVLRLAREPGLAEQVRARLHALPPNRAVYEALDVLAREARAAGC
jgi:1,2-diacylglycerol 3-beta-galactosyltransferase